MITEAEAGTVCCGPLHASFSCSPLLELIWERRKEKMNTAQFEMRAELELAVSIRRRSRSRMVREAADIMENMILNFLE